MLVDAPALDPGEIRHRAICELFERLDRAVMRLASASEKLHDPREPEASKKIVEARGRYRTVRYDVERILAQALHDAEAAVIHDLATADET